MEQIPAFGQVRVDYDTTQPQLFIEVDRARASDLGVDIDGLGEALQAVLDGRTVATVFLDDKSHDVRMISTSDPVNDPGDLERIFVKSGTGSAAGGQFERGQRGNGVHVIAPCRRDGRPKLAGR
jgi:HAE1 family hydrophobic/amphiphilic exporter-1